MAVYNKEKNEVPLVSILILNYNGANFLKDCFDSLIKSTYKNMEIFLVDNDSTDESVSFTQTNYDQVKIFQTNQNKGFSSSYNMAFEVAGGKYFVLLNNDVEVSANWLEPLVKAAEKDAKIAALQPKILSMNNREYFDYAGASGGYIDKYGYPFARGRLFYTVEKDKGQYDTEEYVFWTSGAAMFIRADALVHSGNLDEKFEFHMEEIDLCWRLNLAGYKLKVIPQSTIYHFGGGSLKQGSFRKLYLNHRNNIFMMLKNLELRNLFRCLILRYILDVINIIFSTFMKFDFKHSFAIIKAHLWILLHFKLIIIKRIKVQKKRIISERMINHLIYDKSIIIQYFLKGRKTFSELRYSKK